MATRELFLRYPKARSLPFVELATLPTPVEPLTDLSREVGLPELWVKRDDLSGSQYGGNKVRKLEFILGDALEKKEARVWTVGAVGSHHVLATSIYARQLGLIPEALHFPQPKTSHVREVLYALSTTNPSLTLLSSKNGLPGAMIKTRVKEWLSRGENPYYIPGGGSSPAGVLGYVNAGLELARQIEDSEMPMPDALFVAAGTCGTLAGLVLGTKMAGLPFPIIGVRVVDKVISNPLLTRSLANKAGKLLRAAGLSVPQVELQDIQMIDDQIGAGYGVPTHEGAQVQRAVNSMGIFELDPTYTAKAFAGMVDFHKKKGSPGNGRYLYWHTLSGADLGSLIEKADPKTNLPREYEEYWQ